MSCIALQTEASSSCVDINHRAALVLSAEGQRLQMVSVAVAKEVEKHSVKQHEWTVRTQMGVRAVHLPV